MPLRNSAKQRILIADPETSTRGVIEQILRQEGFDVFAVGSSREALQIANKQIPDLLIVDVHLPDLQGADICQTIRQTPHMRTVPMLAISSKGTDGLAAHCLNNGADGYLHKRAENRVWVAQVRALLRRSGCYISPTGSVDKGPLTLRLAERRVLYEGKDISDLTPKEFGLLQELVLNSPNVVDKNVLVLKIWGVPLEQVGRLTLDVHIQRLRKKLGPSASRHLKTISLLGYKWLESDPSPPPAR